MNISALIASYSTDPACSYSTLRHKTRKHYDSLCRRIDADMGPLDISEITTRGLLLTYKEWAAPSPGSAERLILEHGPDEDADNRAL